MKKIFIPNSGKENIKKAIILINNPYPETYFQFFFIIIDICIGV